MGNPDLTFLGVVVSAYEMRVGAHVGQLDGARKIFGDSVWGVVPRRSLITDADDYALPLSELSDSHEARSVFELLTDRFTKEISEP